MTAAAIIAGPMIFPALVKCSRSKTFFVAATPRQQSNSEITPNHRRSATMIWCAVITNVRKNARTAGPLEMTAALWLMPNRKMNFVKRPARIVAG